ncbi:extracellular solute-binding protein [Pseudohalocynthiibacter aestuariivivens]|jgi:microcin C transport system substrate-binding protein|uniref:Extracellular solute-binding protein n=1 Tax=Pseudohalocynthiibacter aestuariivivens TaxID=1591409 RepID=A0ABV5JJP5_9RHOB|nr:MULTISPECIES: extracellular solute-binding protein [Pseudohalocynthiibacter]MBS9717415.1 ABC transporter substrate-binding protein [Pseudohalocynthiibacter aestuariivivens]MCK0102251.1 extracellular solute-binding protein [Pseudohalocynthiibacter sp. F2068]
MPDCQIAMRDLRILGIGTFLSVLFVALFWSQLAQAENEIIRSHGISTLGELKYGPDISHLDYVNPEAPKGGEISIWAFGSFDSMNPYSTKGRSGAMSNAFFESLLTGTADEIGSSYGLIAESLEYPKDRSWVIFNMRPEAQFSDGTPLTADDVLFSYEIILEQGLPSYRAVLSSQVERAEVLGPHQVKFTFKEGVPTRDLPETVGGLPIFSKTFFEENDRNLEDSSLQPFLGSGPYVLAEMDEGQSLIYAYNPDYWGADLAINVGRNNFERIRIEYYADYNAAFEGFKGGSYTFRNEASSKIWGTGYDFPAIDNGWVKKVELPDGSVATGQSFVFNLRRPQFQDIRVREAIGLMFNFEWSNETLFYGLYERIHSFWENTELAASGMPSTAELALLEPLADLLPPGVLDSEPVLAPESRTRQFDRGNLRKASALLDEAGWIVGDDGLRRDANGRMLRIEFLNDSQTFDRVINPFVENLRRLGVDARHERVDNAQAINRERSHDFDFVTTQFPLGYIPGAGLRQYFGSATADTSVFNTMGLKNEAVDNLVAHVEAAQTQEELETAIHALDRVLRAERFWVPQWFKDSHTVAYYDMFEHPEELPPYSLGHLDFWWYNAERGEELRAAGAFQ